MEVVPACLSACDLVTVSKPSDRFPLIRHWALKPKVAEFTVNLCLSLVQFVNNLLAVSRTALAGDLPIERPLHTPIYTMYERKITCSKIRTHSCWIRLLMP
jgi:hypothetical protein